MDSDRYQVEALSTLSNALHDDLVDSVDVMTCLMQVSRYGNILDSMKKALFYGKIAPDNELRYHTSGFKFTETNGLTPELMHGVIGCITESAELSEALTKVLRGGAVDKTNMLEEVGDVLWYLAVILNELGYGFGEAMTANIAKLRLRFPNAFTEFDAVNRDLQGERTVLESVGHGSETLVAVEKRLQEGYEKAANAEHPNPKRSYIGIKENQAEAAEKITGQPQTVDVKRYDTEAEAKATGYSYVQIKTHAGPKWMLTARVLSATNGNENLPKD